MRSAITESSPEKRRAIEQRTRLESSSPQSCTPNLSTLRSKPCFAVVLIVCSHKKVFSGARNGSAPQNSEYPAKSRRIPELLLCCNCSGPQFYKWPTTALHVLKDQFRRPTSALLPTLLKLREGGYHPALQADRIVVAQAYFMAAQATAGILWAMCQAAQRRSEGLAPSQVPYFFL